MVHVYNAVALNKTIAMKGEVDGRADGRTGGRMDERTDRHGHGRTSKDTAEQCDGHTHM
jgi:hypothetical protein